MSWLAAQGLCAPRYYHGGPAGLRAILPPNVTGAPSSADFGAHGVARRDRVYVTTDADAAAVFAAFAPVDGAVSVYEVRPIGELAEDPDALEPGLSFEAERAEVLAVVETFDQAQRQALIGGIR